MNDAYMTAIEVRLYKLFRDVADGSVNPMDGAHFACDEIRASYGRGVRIGETSQKENASAHIGDASHIHSVA